MAFINVVFPQPLGPINAIHSPLQNVIFTESNTCNLPNRFDILFITIKAAMLALKAGDQQNFQVLNLVILFLIYQAT